MTLQAEVAPRPGVAPEGARPAPSVVGIRPCLVSVLSPDPVVRAGLDVLLGRRPDRVSLTPFTTDASGPRPEVVLYDSVCLLEGDDHRLDVLVALSGTAVVVLARDLRPDLGAQAMAKGADLAVSLAASADEIVDAAEAARGLLSGRRVEPTPRLGQEAGLTPREVDVLRAVTAGMTNQEIAESLFVSINSVKTYIRSAYRRIGARSRPQAVVWCLRHGFPTERSPG